MTDGVPPASRRRHWEHVVRPRWLLVDEYTTGEPDGAVALCADIDGLFVDPASTAINGAGNPMAQGRSEPRFHPVTLVGCRPEPALRRALDALDRGAGNPGGALHRRQINASIFSVAHDGTVTPVGAYLLASVTGARLSTLGDGLLDVAFDAPTAEPLPAGARQIWELWRAGRPRELGLWGSYDPGLRGQWVAAALAHHRHDAADKPAGATYHLDGRTVTTLDGFYCALGEAINGPGGYFGRNADALHDCLRGRFGAIRPFHLAWHDSAVARGHLPPITNHAPGEPAVGTFDRIVRWLAEDGIEVTLH